MYVYSFRPLIIFRSVSLKHLSRQHVIPKVSRAGQRWTFPLISGDDAIHHFGVKDKNAADAHFSPHSGIKEVTRTVRGRFPTYFPTVFSITFLFLAAHKNTHFI